MMKSPDELFETQNRLGLRVLDSSFEFLPQHGWLKSVEGVLIPFAQTRIEELRQDNGVTVYAPMYPFLRLV